MNTTTDTTIVTDTEFEAAAAAVSARLTATVEKRVRPVKLAAYGELTYERHGWTPGTTRTDWVVAFWLNGERLDDDHALGGFAFDCGYEGKTRKAVAAELDSCLARFRRRLADWRRWDADADETAELLRLAEEVH